MIIAKITAEKAEELTGTEMQPGQFYNPIQLPLSEDWFISLVEAQYLNMADVVEFRDHTPSQNVEDELT